MRVDCDFKTFQALMPKMKFIFVEETETSFLFLGNLENTDITFEYTKVEDDMQNVFFINSHFNSSNVFKVNKIGQTTNLKITTE